MKWSLRINVPKGNYLIVFVDYISWNFPAYNFFKQSFRITQFLTKRKMMVKVLPTRTQSLLVAQSKRARQITLTILSNLAREALISIRTLTTKKQKAMQKILFFQNKALS